MDFFLLHLIRWNTFAPSVITDHMQYNHNWDNIKILDEKPF